MQQEIEADWHLFFRTLFGFCVSALLVPLVMAGENEVTHELVRRVTVDDADLWKEAPKLYVSIAADSKLKPVASQAMALIEIRRGNYSEAWKLLSAQSSNLESAPISYRLGHEKLILWLLLEANSVDKAESQFKRLVTIAINKDLPDPEQRDLCHFLGGVIGMEKSEGTHQRIEDTTLDKGKIAIENLKSKQCVEQFNVAFQDSQSWSVNLQTRVAEFKQLGPEKSQLLLESQQKEVETAANQRSNAKNDLRAVTEQKDVVEEERKKIIATQNRIKKEWNAVTPGKPREPIRPTGSPPREPSKVYKTDSKTGQRSYDLEANARKEQEYRDDLRVYEQRLQRYRSEKAKYEIQLVQWKKLDEARRAQLRANQQISDNALKAKQPEVDAALEAFKTAVLLSKKSEQTAKEMYRALTIATIAARNSNLNNSTQSLIRPSNFQILQFESEIFRLQKCLRESIR